MRNKFIGGILGVLLLAALPAAAFAQIAIGVSVNTAPPPLPVYAQPACPGVGYMWTPGYWAWDEGVGDYYWVPGTWVMAPEPGMLWTPGWWGWSGGAYAWHGGYWGPQVGFYGGVDYGFGYSGNGYGGGYWRANQFYYNRSVNNISNTSITNIYNSPAPRGGESHVSYNGGPGGLSAQPSAEQRAAEHAHHVGPTAAQSQHEQAASHDQRMRASVNHGKPPVAATAKPGQFSGKDVVAAIAAGGAVHAAARGAARSGSSEHGKQQAAEAGHQQQAQQQRSAQAERRQNAEEQQRSAQAERRQNAEEQQRSAQAERRQNAEEQQRSAQAEQRQHAEQQPSRIREAQAAPGGREAQPGGARPQPPRGNEQHARKPPSKPRQEEKKPQG